jgi:hypothetical protein
MQYPSEPEKNLAPSSTKTRRWPRFLVPILQGRPCKKTEPWFDFWEITHLWPRKPTDYQSQTKPQTFLLARSKGEIKRWGSCRFKVAGWRFKQKSPKTRIVRTLIGFAELTFRRIQGLS